MISPDLAAKARELRDRQWGCDNLCHMGTHCHCLEAILSALTEADAAATERAATLADDRAARLRVRHSTQGGGIYRRMLWHTIDEIADLAAAIRNQEKPDV